LSRGNIVYLNLVRGREKPVTPQGVRGPAPLNSILKKFNGVKIPPSPPSFAKASDWQAIKLH